MHADIPLFDLTAQHAALDGEIRAAIDRVFVSGRFILADEVATLEQKVATFVGVREAVACASGTDALHLALRGAGAGPGDEVITSAFSFIASAEAALHVGATPIFADVNPTTFTLDPASVEAALSPKTRAIVAVHLYGHPADADALLAIAAPRNIALIEDCAQAFGARYKSQRAGSLALAGAHSFFPTKIFSGCGDGGMITTDDEGLARRLRQLRNHGALPGERREITGYNSRLDEIQAAILRVKLRHVEEFIRKRREIAAVYTDALQDYVQTPTTATDCEHAFNQYTVLSDRRNTITAALNKAGIGNRIYYPTALPDEPALRNVCRTVDYKESQRAARQCLSLPMFPELPLSDARRVAATVIKALE